MYTESAFESPGTAVAQAEQARIQAENAEERDEAAKANAQRRRERREEREAADRATKVSQSDDEAKVAAMVQRGKTPTRT